MITPGIHMKQLLTRLALASAARPTRRGERPPPAGLTTALPQAEVARRLRAVDLVAADIDECVFPGFTQTFLGHLTFFHILGEPQRPADLGLLRQLARGGLYIRKVSLLHRLHRTPSNEALMERYERSMMGIPRAYFDRGAAAIPDLSHPDALACLALLSRRAVVGTVSFGIHLISGAYADALARLNPRGEFFAEANEIRFEPGRDGRPCFSGYRRPLRTDPEEKGHILRRRLKRHGAATPLVFGNGRDEAAMAAEARRRGGLSVGINVVPAEQDLFDVLVHGRGWGPLLELLRREVG